MIVSQPASSPTIEPEKSHVVLEHVFPRPLNACYWEPKDRFIFVGSEDFGISRFDIQSKAIVPMIGPHDSWVRAIGSTPDGRVTFSGGYDGRLTWWPTDAEKPEPIRVVDAHQGWIRALAVSPDGRHVATCGNDLAVKLWDAQSGELVQTFDGHQWHVYNVSFSPSGEWLVSCDLRGFVKVWPAVGKVADAGSDSAKPATRDLPQVETLYKYDPTFRADIGGARCMAFSQDGSRLAIGGVTNVTNAFAGIGNFAVTLVNFADGKAVVQCGPKEKVNGTAWGIAQHSQGFWIGLSGGSGGGWVYFWRDDNAEEFFKLKLKNDGRGMAVSPDGSRIAVAHADRNLRVYALYAAPV
jgi:WD40 repeat protein